MDALANDSGFPSATGREPPPTQGLNALLLLVRHAQAYRRAIQQRLADLAGDEQELLLLWACDAESARHRAAGHDDQPPTQAELARRLGASPAQVSGLVEQFRRSGWLEVARSEDDRRRQCCRTTVAGRSRLAVLLERARPQLAALASPALLAALATLAEAGDLGDGRETRSAGAVVPAPAKPAIEKTRRRAA